MGVSEGTAVGTKLSCIDGDSVVGVSECNELVNTEGDSVVARFIEGIALGNTEGGSVVVVVEETSLGDTECIVVGFIDVNSVGDADCNAVGFNEETVLGETECNLVGFVE